MVNGLGERPGPASGRRIYLANVGANAAHRACSPLFSDGTFELLPIPERRLLPSPPALTYADLRSWQDSGRDLSAFYPASWAGRAVHLDPDFEGLSYGDDCSRVGRGSGLRSLRPGDILFFLARLVAWDEGRASPAPTGAAGFYLVGFLEVEEIVPEVRGALAPALMARFGRNAHVRRALADPAYYDGFWLFGGSPRSRRLRRAVPLDRELAEACLADRQGQPWRWEGGRSDLQVIGSYTRSCRCVLDSARPGEGKRIARWWAAIQTRNPDVEPLP